MPYILPYIYYISRMKDKKPLLPPTPPLSDIEVTVHRMLLKRMTEILNLKILYGLDEE